MKDYIAESKQLTEQQTRRFIRQLIDAIHHIHAAGKLDIIICMYNISNNNISGGITFTA